MWPPKHHEWQFRSTYEERGRLRVLHFLQIHYRTKGACGARQKNQSQIETMYRNYSHGKLSSISQEKV
eukprot:COSAG02_NODE_33154_length_504_cov_1.397531_2_plen_67_part_01